MANVPRGRLSEVREVIPGINGPTIVEVLDGDGWVAAHAVVDADQVYQTIARAQGAGRRGHPRDAHREAHAMSGSDPLRLFAEGRLADLAPDARRHLLLRAPADEPDLTAAVSDAPHGGAGHAATKR